MLVTGMRIGMGDSVRTLVDEWLVKLTQYEQRRSWCVGSDWKCISQVLRYIEIRIWIKVDVCLVIILNLLWQEMNFKTSATEWI